MMSMALTFTRRTHTKLIQVLSPDDKIRDRYKLMKGVDRCLLLGYFVRNRVSGKCRCLELLFRRAQFSR
jgi:hypothetical protein